MNAKMILPLHSTALDRDVEPLVLEQTPSVLSIGRRCMEEGFSFWWPAGGNPILYMPDGRQIELEVIDYIPYLREKNTKRAVVAMPSPVALEAAGESAPPPFPARPRRQSYTPVAAPPAPEEPGGAGDGTSTPGSASSGGKAETVADEASEESPGTEAAEEATPEWPDGVPMICGTCGHGDGKETRRLKAEAKSWKHQLTHLPKNPYCWACAWEIDKEKGTKEGRFGGRSI